MKKRVLILGASRYYVRTILAAQELGYEVVVTDKNPESAGFQYADYAEIIDIIDVEGTVKVASKYRVSGILPINDFGVQTAARVAATLGLTGISWEAALNATNKGRMRKIWQESEVPSARFSVVQNLEEALKGIENIGSFPVIVKPCDSRGGGSRGVSKVDSLEDLKESFSFAQSVYEDPSVVIEEFLEGSEHSIETLTFNGTTYILAVGDKIKTPPPFRVDKSVIYPSAIKGDKMKQMKKVAIDAVCSLGIEIGAAHVELCVTKDGPKLFEVGARCGGGGTPDPIVPFVTGINMFKEFIKITVGEPPHQLRPTQHKGCCYHFLTPRPGRLRKVHGLEEVSGWPFILDCGVVVKENDQIQKIKEGSNRAGFVIAGGESREEAIQLAIQAEKTIEFEYF